MKTNTIIIIVVSLSIAGAAYWYFFTGTGNEPPLSVVTNASSAQVQFESLAGKLPSSLDTSIFSDARFDALVDITQPVQLEPVGRLDPLAPIPGVSTL